MPAAQRWSGGGGSRGDRTAAQAQLSAEGEGAGGHTSAHLVATSGWPLAVSMMQG